MFIMYTKTGTLAFASPERLSENCNYTEKIDIWAAGIVLFMLFKIIMSDSGYRKCSSMSTSL